MAGRKVAKDVDEYIGWFPPDVQERLERIRQTMHEAAPGADERIAYAIPSLTLNERPVVYFAAYQNHISVYPAPRGNEQFARELEQYAGGKGTVQFPLDRPIPYDLIRRLVKFRLEQADVKKKGAK